MKYALEIKLGGLVRFQGRAFAILRVLGLEEILAKEMDTGHVATLSTLPQMLELNPFPSLVGTA